MYWNNYFRPSVIRSFSISLEVRGYSFWVHINKHRCGTSVRNRSSCCNKTHRNRNHFISGTDLLQSRLSAKRWCRSIHCNSMLNSLIIRKFLFKSAYLRDFNTYLELSRTLKLASSIASFIERYWL